MAMPAANREASRRWAAREVRELIAESPLQTPRYELVDGELLVTPSPIVPHQRAVAFLWRALDDYLQRNPVGEAYFSPSDVELEAGTIVQPDARVTALERRPADAAESFRLDLPKYFAAVFREPTV